MPHSPGPWIAKQLDEEHLFPLVGINGRNIVVNEGRSMEECRDNARLIASAPELLNALQIVEERLTKVARAFYQDGKRSSLLKALDNWTADVEIARMVLERFKND